MRNNGRWECYRIGFTWIVCFIQPFPGTFVFSKSNIFLILQNHESQKKIEKISKINQIESYISKNYSNTLRNDGKLTPQVFLVSVSGTFHFLPLRRSALCA